VSEGVAVSLGVPENLRPIVKRSPIESTPPTINDAETAQILRTAFDAELGEGILFDQEREGMGAEDFAYFVTPETGVKGVYFSVGGTPADEVATAPSHHSPFFKVQAEPAIKLGTEAMVVGAMTLLAQK
jgi:hippurate hydrolase